MTMLFTQDDLPRAKRVWRMHVIDAGHGMIMFRCERSGHETGWIKDRWTIAENRRGQPCPACNREPKLDWQKMNVMEPDWFHAINAGVAVELHMTWDEDEWLLCRGSAVLFHTKTPDLIEAQKRAENWLEHKPY